MVGSKKTYCIFAVLYISFLSVNLFSLDIPDQSEILLPLQSSHPRLLIEPGGFTAVKQKMNSHQQTRDWYDDLKIEADNIISEPASTYDIPDGLRLLSVSRRVLKRTYTLAFMYRMTGDNKYSQRAFTELSAAAAFPDWNPKHFLDVGEMTHAFAIGYDWLYDVWTDNQKRVIREAIDNYGLQEFLIAHSNNHWFLSSAYNWNTVCNGGIGMGALAVADELPDVSAEVLFKLLNSLQDAGALEQFGPDGAWAESPGYWRYATQYLFIFTAGLESALNDNFGILDIPGIKETGNFPIYVTGNKTFNYADGGAGHVRAPWLFWLGKKFNNPLFSWYQKQWATPEVLDIVWYDTSGYSPTQLGLPLDAYYRKVEVATVRSDWEDQQAIFFGIKAGENGINHSMLETGTFILDALGERWIHDLGHENYNVPGYWSMGANGQRWTYYRIRAEGNNTLVINPGNNPDQDPAAHTTISSFHTGPNGGFAIADLTDAYDDFGATRVMRGMALINNKKHVLLQDEIELSSSGEIWSFMNTEALIEMRPDNRSALLTLNKKSMFIKLLSPNNAQLEIRNPTPLPNSPNPSGQNNNSGTKKLSLHFNNITNVTLKVLFIPFSTESDTNNIVVDNRSLSDPKWPNANVAEVENTLKNTMKLDWSLTSDFFRIRINQWGLYKVQLIDLNGKVLTSVEKIGPFYRQEKLTLSLGIYFLKINHDRRSYTYKIFLSR